ncbi:MAG: nucleoside kinase [Spirochaetota bacterium]
MNAVRVTLPDGSSREVRTGTRVAEVFEEAEPPSAGAPLIAVLANNELTSLYYRLDVNTCLEPVTMESSEGRRVYRRSLCFLLAMAAQEICPERHLVIGHSLGNGYYYRFDDDAPIVDEVLVRLEERMHEIVREDHPIVRRLVSYTDALEYFEQHDMEDTAQLLKHRNDAKIPVYTCGDTMDISHGPLVPSTGALPYFELAKYPPGFILRFPRDDDPYHLGPFEASPILFSVYQEYKQWGKILNVSSVGKLNDLTASGGILDFIRVAEALQNKKIAEIADRVHKRRASARIVLIAGPSSSGKTTFAKKLSIQLTVLGFKPVAIGLDDYFVPREQTPLDEEGNYDFEHIEAIDIALLNRHLEELLAGKEIELPRFSFKTGTRSPSGRYISLPDRGVLIMEGIHGLNDRLTPRIEAAKKFKVYVSALTQLNLDDHNRISTTDNRLIRRLVRDHKFRGHSALETLHMWPSVRRGENRNIFPFQDSADVAFNSALDYELGVLRNHALPLLDDVKPFHDVYHEAVRLLSFLENFTPIPERNVPETSILREFVGDSGFSYK